jgi:bifunctional DNA-binding transcriptional regulator/antitoxin component of YhaV-PrlF toxin-antitoxin module
LAALERFQKVLTGRRVTIPEEFAAELELLVGDPVIVAMSDGVLTVRKAKVVPT